VTRSSPLPYLGCDIPSRDGTISDGCEPKNCLLSYSTLPATHLHFLFRRRVRPRLPERLLHVVNCATFRCTPNCACGPLYEKKRTSTTNGSDSRPTHDLAFPTDVVRPGHAFTSQSGPCGTTNRPILVVGSFAPFVTPRSIADTACDGTGTCFSYHIPGPTLGTAAHPTTTIEPSNPDTTALRITPRSVRIAPRESNTRSRGIRARKSTADHPTLGRESRGYLTSAGRGGTPRDAKIQQAGTLASHGAPLEQ
jgi:hypothetical protein